MRMPVVVVTDSTASLPAERGGRARHRGRAAAGRDRRDGLRRGRRRCDARHGRRGAARVDAGEHLAAGAGALLEVYERPRADGATEIVSVHLSGRDERHLRVRPAGGAGTRSIPVHAVDTGRSGSRTGYAALTAADVLDAGGTREEAAAAALARGAGGDLAVLRRHAGVPPPRRADRRRGRAARRRAVGEAAAARSRTARWRRCERVRTAVAGAGPARGARRRGGRRPAGRRLRGPPRQRGPRRGARRRSWPSGSPTAWRAAR